MRHDRPTPQELAESVREFLQDEILPILDDHRLKFRTLVAINGLGIAERELWASATPAEDGTGSWHAGSAPATFPTNAVALLKEQVAEKLRVSNPRSSPSTSVRRRLYPDAARRGVVRRRRGRAGDARRRFR